jgi:ATP-binding cassette, subfamily B, bacterial PglK
MLDIFFLNLRKIIYLTDKKKYYKSIIFYSSAAFLDLLALSFVAPLIEIITQTKSKTNIWNNLIDPSNPNAIYFVGIILISIYIIKSFFNFNALYYIIRFCADVQNKIRNKIFSFYKNIFVSDLGDEKLESYINNISYVTNVFTENILHKSILIISEILIITIILFFLAYTNIFGFCFFLFFFLIFFSIYYKIVRVKIKTVGKKQSDALKSLINIVTTVFSGYKEIKIFNVENFFDKKFRRNSEKFLTSSIDYHKLIYLPKYFLEAILISFLILLLLITTYFTSTNILSNLEIFTVYLLASIRLTPLAYNIFASFSVIISSKFALDQISDELNKIYNYGKSKIYYNKNKNKIELNYKSFNSLQLTNLKFSYNEKNYILNDLNLRIEKGDIIGLKGKSGTGKTTIVNLLLGLLNLNKKDGKLIVNDKFEIDETNLRSLISYTPQKPFILEGESISRNIAIGLEDSEINYERIKQCILSVDLNEKFLKTHENKTSLLDKNINSNALSGGQAQKIAIARNIYYERFFNIFDEFTSALDTDTEDLILKNLKKVISNQTTIIISHRESTLKFCNKIFELKDNKLNQIKI